MSPVKPDNRSSSGAKSGACGRDHGGVAGKIRLEIEIRAEAHQRGLLASQYCPRASSTATSMNFILPKHRPAPQENSISDCPDPVTIASTASTEQQQHLLPFDANVAKEYLSNSTALSLPSVTFTPCQCDKIGFGAMLGDPALKTPCASYFDAQIMLNLLTAAASIIVVGLNIGLKGSLLKLSRYERPPTVSSLHARTVSKVFLAQWMNTAVILVMLNNRFMRTLISGEGDYAVGLFLSQGR